jgi:hypothetical protein
MTVTIDLRPEVASALQEQARASALTLDDYLARLVEAAAGPVRKPAAVDLLTSWANEDATTDAAEIEARQASFEAMKNAMNEGHSSDRALFR